MQVKATPITHLPVTVYPINIMYMYVEVTLHVFLEKPLQSLAFRGQIVILNLTD